mgnify:CR=1 FL=1
MQCGIVSICFYSNVRGDEAVCRNHKSLPHRFYWLPVSPIACFFLDSVNTALVFVLYACLLMYLFSKRELPVLSRMKIMIAAFMFSMLMTAVCIAAAELLRGYFLFDGVLMGCLMFLAMGAVIQTFF